MSGTERFYLVEVEGNCNGEWGVLWRQCFRTLDAVRDAVLGPLRRSPCNVFELNLTTGEVIEVPNNFERHERLLREIETGVPEL